MSRSRKKPFVTLSKAWNKFKEHMFRRLVKQELRNIEKEIPFDPDRDFEASLDYGKMGECGTRLGFDNPPGEEEDTWLHESYEDLKRK